MRCFDATLGVPLRNHHLAGRGCPIRLGQGFETLASSIRKAINNSSYRGSVIVLLFETLVNLRNC